MNTSEKFAVVESFGSSLIVSHNYFIFWDLEMLENLFLNLNLGVPISCLGNLAFLQQLLLLILTCLPPVLKIQMKGFQKKFQLIN